MRAVKNTIYMYWEPDGISYVQTQVSMFLHILDCIKLQVVKSWILYTRQKRIIIAKMSVKSLAEFCKNVS